MFLSRMRVIQRILSLCLMICVLIAAQDEVFEGGVEEVEAPLEEAESSEETCEAVFGEDASAGCQAKTKIAWSSNAEGKPPEVSMDECVDRRTDICEQYAADGDCEKNPGWMIMMCAATCNACHLRDPAVRCPREKLHEYGMSLEPAYYPGQLNAMFESIVERFGSIYEVEVLSRDPWVVIFDNFLTDAEAKALITNVDEWEASTDTGATNEFGETGRVLSQGRTSSNAWCQWACEDHPDVKSIVAKIENVTNIPKANYESFQILRYELGQKYMVHHDSSAEDNLLACGPRVLTFFLYLSDVEEGGETSFTELDLQVRPKKGRALLWPSVMDDDPTVIDMRTLHEAKAVVKGRKFAANSWIHLYDYNIPNLYGCTGVFD